jgi:polysaccharide biosynthesis protein PelC
MKRLIPLLIATCLAACSTVDNFPHGTLDPGAKWALMPILNQTETPQAGLRTEAVMENLLRGRGIADLQHYPLSLNTETVFEPAENKLQEQALAWAKTQGIRYAVTGAVTEWRYKVGIDGEPAVGTSLEVVELPTGKVVYSASGGKSGWSREALSAVAQKLLREMVGGIPLGAK